MSLRVGLPSRSTKGKIPAPVGKCCPLQVLPWEDCAVRQQQIYRYVCAYLEPQSPEQPTSRLFTPRLALEELGQVFGRRALSSEKDLEGYERYGVENHVQIIISELCKIPAARQQFGLGDGVWFDNHPNDLDSEASQIQTKEDTWPSRPDQFCIHRVDGETNTLLTTVEYKPPHKLSVENLRAGLRPMQFWEEIVRPNSVPTEEKEKLKYNAAWLTGSALVQEYHVMIQEGLEYSYLTNGIALVLLHIPYDNPEILYYYLCESNKDIRSDNDISQQPLTSIARVLCLCLMSFRSMARDQAWRHSAKQQVPEWKTNFDHTLSQIPESEFRQNPPDSEYTSPESSAHGASEYLPSSSFEEPTEGEPTEERWMLTRSRSRAQCAPNTTHRGESPDSDIDTAPGGRKRGFSEITSSSSQSIGGSPNQSGSQHNESGGRYQHNAQFCTQKCLLGLKQRGKLDERCPNVELHRRDGNDNHLIDTISLVKLINQQLDKNLDFNCTPMGGCGSTGAPFKVTCTAYGYTVVGKGTTSNLWGTVSRESEIYRFLKRAQGSAIPVFLGKIDLAMTYFLHGAGSIRHMLLMGWAGKHIDREKYDKVVKREISRSKKEIISLGVLHQDLRLENILWNAELNRALIIDFEYSQLDPRFLTKRPRHLKGKPALRKRLNQKEEEGGRKRLCVA
ncbi:hypothetical protein McanCB56680_006659 [Microsporum canis]